MALKEARPYEQVDKEIVLLAGGPSLNDFEDEIRQKRETMPVITTNGAYNWCLDRGINPSAQVVVDAREYNKRFVTPHVPNCHYFLASQCHPEIVKAAPRDQVYLWHAGMSDPVKETVEAFAKDTGNDRNWFPVMGGSTVMLRALPLLIMLGYSRMHIYGWDSCVMEDKHHAYPQPENDGKRLLRVGVGGKQFQCQMWMWVQAQEFIDIQRMIADHCELAVYGDGLIATIIKTAYEKSKE